MSRPEEPAGGFDAAAWEQRYRAGEGTGRHEPSPSLVAEVGGLAPGRALDAGCGRGADALWLAARGWQVTAVDVSATAVGHGRSAAPAAGPDVADRVEWVCADLSDWDPGERRFDLVTCSYVHVPGPPEELFRRLASWVAPGGTLLVAGHGAGHGDGPGAAAVHGHQAHPPAAQLRAEQVTAGLPGGRWEVVVAGPRTHVVTHGAGTVSRCDVVVRARRTGS